MYNKIEDQNAFSISISSQHQINLTIASFHTGSKTVSKDYRNIEMNKMNLNYKTLQELEKRMISRFQ